MNRRLLKLLSGLALPFLGLLGGRAVASEGSLPVSYAKRAEETEKDSPLYLDHASSLFHATDSVMVAAHRSHSSHSAHQSHSSHYSSSDGGGGGGGTPLPPVTWEHTYELPGTSKDGTTIIVNQGDTLTITATGAVSPGAGIGLTCTESAGPGGLITCQPDQAMLDKLHGFPFLALVAYFNGEWILIGETFTQTFTNTGPFVIYVNDPAPEDNVGTFSVKVNGSSPSTASSDDGGGGGGGGGCFLRSLLRKR